ncbi:radical SAM family heme chaperone HemW [uncultured Allomuricauda sp.]|uniref:radical SAM family heme chaperone HemW n=1 Tax=Flagellimonas sp. W118 TaxID=3410791 RepID=UPI002606E475|nr:radical SAM family heme chaperone HemW [uncultured Allomuricauda sp.]
MAGVYIHVPFCKQACHYCDFHFSTQLGRKESMIKALQKELELRKGEFQSVVVETVYFGGGTPSVLEISEIEALITAVYEHYEVIEHPEITLEANPDDLSKNRIIELSESPVNRLSIGIQSFYDEDLKLMNRAHDAGEAEGCIQEAKKHFDNITIDLIYGIPGMDNNRWKSNIEKALAFELPHISSYALTVEPKTALKKFIEKGVIPDVDDEQAQAQFNILVQVLEQQGYINYEISNFGKPGYFSKNNTAYWLGKKYIGIGPSAHSFDGENRGWNVRNNIKYIKALENEVVPMEIETLTKRDRYNEYVMTGLRTIWGVSLDKIEKEFGEEYSNYIHQQAEKYIEQDLISFTDGKLLTTNKGKFLADGIASDLFMVNLKA